jgi:molybdenum cofactor cytidylyltransferase
MQDIWSIILAAGESKRMGSPKMLLPFGGKTIIESIIDKVMNSDSKDIIVVLGAEKEAIANKIKNMPVRYCYNEKFKEGMLSSVKCGFNNLPFGFRAALIFPGDQPMISSEAINSVINAYLHSKKGLVIPVYKNKRGHPLLIDSCYIDEIKNISPSIGLHSLAEKFADDVLEVETDDPGILDDIDTYEEYLQWK